VDDSTPSLQRPLTPGEALMKLFLDNADLGRNAENDDLVVEMQRRIRSLADPDVEP
jgi:hypothetical protein